MNAVEIEEAVSELASEPFDMEAFPFAYVHRKPAHAVNSAVLALGSVSPPPPKLDRLHGLARPHGHQS